MATADQKQVDWNPVAVTEALWDLRHRIQAGVMVVDKAYGAFEDADEAYVMAEAKSYIGFDDKPAHERKYHVVLAIEEERKRRRIAERAYKKATTNMKSLIEGLNAVRSIGAGVRKEFEVAGV